MKITFNNYIYQLKKLTCGEYYITRSFSKKGFKKFQDGKLSLKGGILF